MIEGRVVAWLKKEGEAVERGEPLLEIETDKANLEVEALEAGILRKVLAKEGDVVPVLSVVGVIGAADEAIDYDALVSAAAEAAEESKPTTDAATEPSTEAATPPADAELVGHTVLMPQAGQSMTEGRILSWLKNEGDAVERGEPLVEIETDKANLEIEALAAGHLRKIFANEGELVPVLAAVAVIGPRDADIDFDEHARRAEAARAQGTAPPPAAPTASPAPARSPAEPAAATNPRRPAPAVASPTVTAAASRRLAASPLARRVAKERGVTLSAVRGTGPNGRILRRDVEAAPAGGGHAAANGAGIDLSALGASRPYPEPAARPPAEVPLTGMRGAIASALQQSKQTLPHFYEAITADVTALLERRSGLEQEGARVSVNDFVVRAVAIALADEPRVNCRVADDRIEYPSAVNIGIAVGTEDGLVVPVVQNAATLDLVGLSAESKRIIEAARSGKLIGMGTGTFTISNLGMFGIESFSAIINPPEGAILAVGAARPELRPWAGGFAPRAVMTLTLSADHRAIDGVLAARFLSRLRSLLEEPDRL